MALRGAIETLRALSKEVSGPRVVYVSDSQYLVKGMSEWIVGWRARGWRRKGGEIENLAMWQELAPMATEFSIEWKWVRGHAGHPKNEYVDSLAVQAASEQLDSGGLAESGFTAWLAHKQARGQFIKYDADRDVWETNGEFASRI
jgi:ribonuclease HI